MPFLIAAIVVLTVVFVLMLTVWYVTRRGDPPGGTS